MRAGGAHHRRGERGQAGGVEVLPFGLLVFITGGLLIVNLWGVVDSKFSADAAARDATRYVVETAGSAIDPASVRARAAQLAEATMRDQGRTGPVIVEVTSDTGSIERCTRITVRVSTVVPAIRVPFVGGFGEAFDVVAQHTEVVDPTRSGVEGRASCIR